jgi:hypothetical protein
MEDMELTDQMTIIPVKDLKYLIKPVFENIIRDIIITNVEDDDLKMIRESFCKEIASIIGDRQMFFIGDVRYIFLSMLEDEDTFVKHGDIVIDHIIQWCQSSKTHWDFERLRTPINVIKALLLSKRCKREQLILENT